MYKEPGNHNLLGYSENGLNCEPIVIARLRNFNGDQWAMRLHQNLIHDVTAVDNDGLTGYEARQV